MAMSRKHYIEVAEIIRRARRQNSVEQACDHIAEDLADMFKRDNDAFHRGKFLGATEETGDIDAHKANIRRVRG